MGRSMSARSKKGLALIGNPGSGKSTLLNGLAGSMQFPSGISLGGGLTKSLMRFETATYILYDTPGLQDVDGMIDAAREIDKLFEEDVDLKIAFVLTLESGRLRAHDALTVKVVLDAIQTETNDKFGVILNQVCEDTLAEMEQHTDEFVKLQEAIAGERSTKHWCSVLLDFSIKQDQNKGLITEDLKAFFSDLPVTKPRGVEVKKLNILELDVLGEYSMEMVEEAEKEAEAKKVELSAKHEEHMKEMMERIGDAERRLAAGESMLSAQNEIEMGGTEVDSEHIETLDITKGAEYRV